MVSQENLNRIFDVVISGEELTTKKLTECGYNSKSINKLIEEGKITRVKRGFYELTPGIGKDLFDYGKRLLSLKKYDNAIDCFEKCYELDPSHRSVCFQLFLRSIINEDYERALMLFETLKQTNNKYYQIDYNYYLYLLSVVTEVPEKYKEFVKHMTMDDMRILPNDRRYSDVQAQNQSRYTALKRKFPYAMKQLNELIAKQGYTSTQDFITKALLSKAITSETKSKNEIIELIEKQRYTDVIAYLTKKSERTNLSVVERYILILARTYLDIKNSSKIPIKDYKTTGDVFEAIDLRNYELALELSNRNLRLNNQVGEKNAINMLLNNICELISSLKQQKEVKKEEVSKNDPSVLILSSLLHNDYEKAYDELNKYLTSVGKEEYIPLITELIKLSIYENDKGYVEPMIALTLINRENYKFDMAKYIQEFYFSLAAGDFKKARLYLNIVTSARKIGIESIETSELYKILDKHQIELDKTLDKEESPKYQEPFPEFPTKEQRPEQTHQVCDSEEEYLKRNYEKLCERKGLVLLKPMTYDRTSRTLDMLKQYKDVKKFIIENNGQEQIALKYSPKLEDIEFQTVLKEANKAYSEGDYNEALEKYLLLLQFFHRPKAFIFGKLGLCYTKVNKVQEAIDCLTVATYFSAKEGLDYNFQDLVDKLSGKSRKNNYEVKPMAKVRLEEFEQSDIDNYYGINDIAEISSFIIESGLSVKDACKELEMPEEKTDIVILLYAREYYIAGSFAKGDELLSVFEKSKEKTEQSKKLFEDIRKNKKFYQNREIKNERLIELPSSVRQ